MKQLFANGTHEVVFDDGDRSSAVQHVRASLSPCLQCAALQLQGAGVKSSGVMCGALEGGTPAAASAQTLAYQWGSSV